MMQGLGGIITAIGAVVFATGIIILTATSCYPMPITLAPITFLKIGMLIMGIGVPMCVIGQLFPKKNPTKPL
jgi:dipeptide/tripeptide permease